MEELSFDDAQLLGALREQDEPTRADAARVERRVMQAIAAGAAATATSVAASQTIAAASQGAAAMGSAAIGSAKGAAAMGSAAMGSATLGTGVSTGAAVQAAGVGLSVKVGAWLVGGATLVGGGYFANEALQTPAVQTPTVQDLAHVAPSALSENAPASPAGIGSSPSGVDERPLPQSDSMDALPSEAVPMDALPFDALPEAVNNGRSARTPKGPSVVRSEEAVDPDAKGSLPGHSDESHAREQLGAELGLLREAHEALRSGNAEQALARLREHERRFSQGVLASERRATYAIALCQAGQVQKGRELARRFLSHQLQSPMAGRLRSACSLRED